MDNNLLQLALYEISMSIGNTYDLKRMLNESITMILSRLNCSSASIHYLNDAKFELFYAKPKVLVKNKTYLQVKNTLETKYAQEKQGVISDEFNGSYYYLFELKNFGYLMLSKAGAPLDDFVVRSLGKINLKLINAIHACMERTELEEYKARLSEAQSIAHLGSWSTNLLTNEHHWDDEIFHILGDIPQSFQPTYKRLFKIMTPKSKNKNLREIAQVFRGEKSKYNGKIEIIRKDGTLAQIEVQSRIIYDDKGQAVSLVGTALDISRQNELEEQLRKESSLLKSIINTVPIRIFWKDLNLRYLGSNKLFAKDANLENEDELIGLSDNDMPWVDEADAYREDDRVVMDTGIAKLEFEESQTHEDGSVIWVSTSKVPLKNEEGKIFGILGTYHDITAKKEHEEMLRSHRDALQYQANHDILTGLPNRLLFMDRLNQSLYKANRNCSKVAVLFLDMDRFKEINDSFGHSFGDEAIKEVAQRLKSKVRKSDTVARFGGDEFVMILDDIKDPVAIVNIVQKLTEIMKRPINIHSHTLYVTLSIGISIYPDDTVLATDLLKNADAAMYKAKELGRNTYIFYTEEMTEKAYARITMETNLRHAIANEDFELYFQPQVNALTNSIVGIETLIRWNHSRLGFIPPDEFIPIAEDTGLIIPLGKWILHECMKQATLWHTKGIDPGILSINLSMVQLQEQGFVANLVEMLEDTGCKAQWLELEVTEGQVMRNPERTILQLEEISKLGIEIAIDDFGTGYSSLSYLKRLPIDRLKIDRSFIKDIPDDEEDVVISKAIIALAKSLNIGVIAEGVETEDQKEFLLQNDCKYIQGYFYSKPVPLDEIEIMIQNVRSALPFTHTYSI